MLKKSRAIQKPANQGLDIRSIDIPISFSPNLLLYGINTPVCAIYLITKPEFSIGYASDCDATLHFSREISRHHALITWKDEKYEITDLESTNHTFLNGKQLTPNIGYTINSGDKVSFASFSFEIIEMRF